MKKRAAARRKRIDGEQSPERAEAIRLTRPIASLIHLHCTAWLVAREIPIEGWTSEFEQGFRENNAALIELMINSRRKKNQHHDRFNS